MRKKVRKRGKPDAEIVALPFRFLSPAGGWICAPKRSRSMFTGVFAIPSVALNVAEAEQGEDAPLGKRDSRVAPCGGARTRSRGRLS